MALVADYSRLILGGTADGKPSKLVLANSAIYGADKLLHPVVDIADMTLRFLFSNSKTDPTDISMGDNGFYREAAKNILKTEYYDKIYIYAFWDILTNGYCETWFNENEIAGFTRRYESGTMTGDDLRKFKSAIDQNIESEQSKKQIYKDVSEQADSLAGNYRWSDEELSSKLDEVTLGTWTKVDDGTGRNVWDWTYDNAVWCTIFKNIFTDKHNTDVQIIAAGDTSKVTNTAAMFQNCTALSYCCPFDTSNVTNFEYMFADCNGLLALPEFDFSSMTTMGYFAGRNMEQDYYGSINYKPYTERTGLPPSKITMIPLSYSLPLGDIVCAFKGLDHAVGGFNHLASTFTDNGRPTRLTWGRGCIKANVSALSEDELNLMGIYSNI